MTASEIRLFIHSFLFWAWILFIVLLDTIFIVLVFQFLVNYGTIGSVVLDEVAEEYLERLLTEFSENPRRNSFDHVVQPPLAPHIHVRGEENSSPRHQDFFLPKVFIWSPLEHSVSRFVVPNMELSFKLDNGQALFAWKACWIPDWCMTLVETFYWYRGFIFVHIAVSVTVSFLEAKRSLNLSQPPSWPSFPSKFTIAPVARKTFSTS